MATTEKAKKDNQRWDSEVAERTGGKTTAVRIYEPETGADIATIHGDEGNPNVALIEAAPEMLAALKFSLEVFKRERARWNEAHPDDVRGPRLRERKLQEIIARAEKKA